MLKKNKKSTKNSKTGLNKPQRNGMDIENLKTLVLDSSFQPLSWMPLSLYSWRDVMEIITDDHAVEKVAVLEYYDAVIHSATKEWKIPSVISLLNHAPENRRVPFCRKNVFIRDEFTCQLTGKKYPVDQLTFDHVIPRCKGGRTTWDNIVTACKEANSRKGDRTLNKCGYKLLKQPYEPSYWEIREKAKKCFMQTDMMIHESWENFLYWNSELEK